MAIPQLTPLLSAVQRIKTSSVIAPLLAADVITGAVALLGSMVLPASLVALPWYLFAACVVATLIAYLGWSFANPNRLQTEDYQLAQHKLVLLGDERAPLSSRVIEAQPVANTHLHRAFVDLLSDLPLWSLDNVGNGYVRF